ncbi:Ig-like domain-containing protein [Microbulbifer pacificus]|uniref:Ig-like domain-containing protein n=1 Tax=Microbulbifer pacificus TaxID=407164 RepID=UPI00131A0FDA|nr:Ig-like domain-containing protein [Microbulbifer pacificus]
MSETHEINVSAGKPPVQIQAVQGAYYRLTEGDAGLGPNNIIVKRVGDDLHVTFGCDSSVKPHLVIQDFYKVGGQLIGMTADGNLYEYAAASGEEGDEAPFLMDGESSELVLDASDSSCRLVGSDDDFGALFIPALLGIGALGALAALSRGGSSSSKGKDGDAGQSPGDTLPPAKPEVSGEDKTDGSGNLGPDGQPDPLPEGTHGLVDILDDVGDVQGSILNGRATDDSQPELIGTGEPGDTVIIYDNDQEIGRVVVDENGEWTFTPDQPLSEGEHDFSLEFVDPDGNTSERSDDWTIVVDTTAPDKPEVSGEDKTDENGNPGPDGNPDPLPDNTYGLTDIHDDVGSKTGSVLEGESTDDTQPELIGTGEAGNTVIIYDNDQEIGRVVVDENGEWTFTPDQPLSEGEHDFSLEFVDPDGNTSERSDDWTIVVDTTAPDKPEVSGEDKTDENGNPGPDGNPDPLPDNTYGLTDIRDDVGSKTGSVLDGEPTDDAQPELIGTGEAGNTVIIYDNDQEIGRVVVDENGEWTFTPDQPLTDGDHAFSIEFVDPAGNTSPRSDDWTIVVDTAAPGNPGGGIDDSTTPVNENLAAPIVDEMDNDGVINKAEAADGTVVRIPGYDGMAEGDVIVLDWNGTEIEYTVTAADVNVQEARITVPAAELSSDASFDIDYMVRDKAGNESGRSLSTAVVIDLTGPDKPEVSGEDKTDENGNPGPDGNPDPLPGNTYGLTDIHDDVGSKTGSVLDGESTDDTQPELIGTGEAGNTVIIYDNGQKLGEAVVGQDGKWSFTPPQALADGEHKFSIEFVDPAGNSSPRSDDWTIVVDTTAPDKPEVSGEDKTDENGNPGPDGNPDPLPGNTYGLTDIHDDVGSKTGSVLDGESTDDTQPELIGTGEAGNTVIIYDDGQKLGEAVVGQDGKWSFTPPQALADGEHKFSIEFVDPAGNRSPRSDDWTIVVDTAAPGNPGGGIDDSTTPVNENLAAPIVDEMDNDGVINKAEAADGTVVRIPGYDGMAEGDVIVLDWNGTEIEYTVTAADVNVQEARITVPAAELSSDASFDIDYMVRDKAGNESGRSLSTAVVIDLTGPDKPEVSGEDKTDENGNPGPDGNPDPLPGNTYGLTDIHDDVGSKTGSVLDGESTDDTQPELIGTGEAGNTVIIYDDGQKLGEAVVGQDGKWSFTPPQALADGEHKFSIEFVDPAGNSSPRSDDWTIVVDTTAPDKPEVSGEDKTDENGNPGPDGNPDPLPGNTYGLTDIHDDVGSKTGSVLDGESTDDTQPELIGTGEAGNTVIIYDDGQKLGEAVVGQDGKWSFTPPQALADGEHKFSIEFVDPAGNRSPRSDDWTIVVDTAAPGNPGGGIDDSTTPVNENLAAPIVDEMDNDGVINKAEAADGTVVRIPGYDGMAEGDVIVLDWNGTEIEYTVTAADVNVQEARITVPAAELSSDASFDIDYMVRDKAGNESGRSLSTAVVIDLTGPDKPEVSGEDKTDENGNPGPDGNPDPLPGNTYGLTDIHDDVGSKTGSVLDGESTDDTQPELIGTGEAGNTVIIYDDGQKLGEAVVGQDGKWSFTPPQALADGEHKFSIEFVDPAGNSSPRSDDWTIVVDTTAPDKPEVSGEDKTDENGNPGPDGNPDPLPGNTYGLTDIHDDVGSKTGSVLDGESTDDTQPELIGTGEAGNTVIIYDDGQKLGEAVVGQDGKWSFTPPQALADGEHKFSIEFVDPAGNRSPRSDDWTIVVDTAAPGNPGGGIDDSTTPVNENLAAPIVDEMDNDGVINKAEAADGTVVRIPGYDGMAEGDVIVLDWNGTEIEYTVTAADVNVQEARITVPAAELSSDASFDIDYMVRDKAGNESGRSLSTAVVIDLTGPDKPEVSGEDKTDENGNPGPDGNPDPLPGNTYGLTDIHDDVGSKTGSVLDGESTDDTQPELIGTGEAGNTVIIYDDGQKLGEAVVGQDGKWSFTPPQALADGQHKFSIEFVDPAGNSSPRSDDWTIVVDTAAPGNPGSGDISQVTYSGDIYVPIGAIDEMWMHDTDANGDGDRGAGGQMGVSIFTLSGPATRVSFEYYALDSTSTYAVFLNENGQVVARELIPQAPRADGKDNSRVFTFDAPNGESFSSIRFENGDEGVASGGINDMSWIMLRDTFSWVPSSSVVTTTSLFVDSDATNPQSAAEPVALSGLIEREDVIDLEMIKAELSDDAQMQPMDLSGGGSDALELSLGDLLSMGLPSDDDGSAELTIHGEIGDKVVLNDLLVDGSDTGNWEQALETLDKDGITYNIFHHDGEDATLLIQKDIEVVLENHDPVISSASEKGSHPPSGGEGTAQQDQQEIVLNSYF